MEFSPDETTPTINTETIEPHHKKNLYPTIRHIFLLACTLAFLAVLVLLLYQNGKSIYDNGI